MPPFSLNWRRNESFKALRVEDSYRLCSWFASSVAITSLSPLNFHVSTKVKKKYSLHSHAHQPAINLSPVKFRYRRSSVSRNTKSLLTSVIWQPTCMAISDIGVLYYIFARGIVYYIFFPCIVRTISCTLRLRFYTSIAINAGYLQPLVFFLCVVHSLTSLLSEILYNYNALTAPSRDIALSIAI